MIERDPTGKRPSDPGAKLDEGKLLAGLLLDFSHALTALAEIASGGARKYSPGGWLHVEDGIRRYTDAMWRHLLAHGRGEEVDPDSGQPHLHHCLWNITAIIELRARHNKEEKEA